MTEKEMEEKESFEEMLKASLRPRGASFSQEIRFQGRY